MFLAISASTALGLGCGSNTPSSPNSFTRVYTEIIKPTSGAGCSTVYCHYNYVGIKYSALDMSSQVFAYWSLVGTPCMGASCAANGTRVVPGQPEASIMYLKVSEPTPPCGSQMPADVQTMLLDGYSKFSGNALSADQQQLIHDWIQEGAQNN
jgi:hypothetical protein